MMAAPALPYIAGMIVIIILIIIMLGPIMEMMASLEGTVSNVGNFFEKLGNAIIFRGFKTNVEADRDEFYNKLKEYYKSYGEALDVPLVLSTIYYPYDVAYNKNTDYCLSDEGKSDPGCESYTVNNDQTQDGNKKEENILSGKTQRLNALVNNMIVSDQGMPRTDYNKYDQYLKDTYIKESPEFEFSKVPIEKQEDILNFIVKDIHDRANLYKELFEKHINSNYNDIIFNDSHIQVVYYNQGDYEDHYYGVAKPIYDKGVRTTIRSHGCEQHQQLLLLRLLLITL
jgi:hypothetical protein